MEPVAAAQTDEAYTNELAKRFYSRTQKLAGIAAAVGFALGAAFAGLAFYMVAQGERARLGAVFLFPFGGAAFASAMTMGLSLFFAPNWYFETSYGALVLKTVGTKNILVAKLVVIAFLLLGLAIVSLFAGILVYEELLKPQEPGNG